MKVRRSPLVVSLVLIRLLAGCTTVPSTTGDGASPPTDPTVFQTDVVVRA